MDERSKARRLVGGVAVWVSVLAVTVAAQETPTPAPAPAEAEAPKAAEAAPEEGDKWQIVAPILIWLPALDGDITIKGETGDADLSYSDVDFGFQAYVEVSKGRWGGYIQPNYLRLSDDGDLSDGTDVDADLGIWIVELAGFYRLWTSEEPLPMSLDVIGGGRYWHVETDFDIDAPGAPDVDSQADLIDPVIGARHKLNLTEKLHFNTRFDLGGFNISSESSNLSWQAVGLLAYDITKRLTILGGYRAIDIDAAEGGGDNKKGLDLTIHGVIFGLHFKLF
jgi:hypothetical protein